MESRTVLTQIHKFAGKFGNFPEYLDYNKKDKRKKVLVHFRQENLEFCWKIQKFANRRFVKNKEEDQ